MVTLVHGIETKPAAKTQSITKRQVWEAWFLVKRGGKRVGIDGLSAQTDKGTPQGGVLIPLLANLFLHEAFDLWIQSTQPRIVFERYADGIVIHTRSWEQSEFILDRLRTHLQGYGLELNGEKTKMVYCHCSIRSQKEPKEVARQFDFLGYTFKPRLYKKQGGELFWSYFPAISRKNQKRILD